MKMKICTVVPRGCNVRSNKSIWQERCECNGHGELEWGVMGLSGGGLLLFPEKIRVLKFIICLQDLETCSFLA